MQKTRSKQAGFLLGAGANLPIYIKAPLLAGISGTKFVEQHDNNGVLLFDLLHFL